MKRSSAKRFLVLFVIPVLLIGFWMFNTVTAQSKISCVCHVEDKEAGKGHVIEVDDNSLAGHLRHGDKQCTVDCEDLLGKRCNIAGGGACTN